MPLHLGYHSPGNTPTLGLVSEVMVGDDRSPGRPLGRPYQQVRYFSLKQHVSESRMAYPIFFCSKYRYTSGLAKAASPRDNSRSPFAWYLFTTGSRSSCQPSALWTLPGLSVAPSQSPNWLKRKRG